MKNLSSVHIQMSKSAGRVQYGSIFNSKPNTNIESCDPSRAFFAKRDFANGKKKEIMLADMASSLSRDDKMYTTTDFLANINLDNTRSDRLSEQNRKNEDRMMRMRLHT